MGNQSTGLQKGIVVGGFTALTAWLGMLAIPMYILVGLNVVDYITGLVAAPYRGQQRQSGRGFSGILKKVCMWFLVGIGGAVDWLLVYAASDLNINLPFNTPVAIAVAVWLLINEIISILENIDDIGVALPPFLKPLIMWVKQGTEYGQEVVGKEN